jgi:cyanophycin synthetase
VHNIAGAALAALALGISTTAITSVLTSFGADPTDNPGRLMRYTYRGAQVLIDYAHNPDGLRGLMSVATRLARTGRVALVLGQAGNRTNADMDALTAAAAEFRPDLVVVKEIESYLRGRAPGEIPTILREGLLRGGLPESSVEIQMTELAAVQRVLSWAQPGDVLVLPVHNRAVRDEVIQLLRG